MKALVTGASSGIGKDIAIYLSELGHDLVLVARNKQNLEELKKQLKTNVDVIDIDLSVYENCIKLYEQVKKYDIDILVNNAGFGTFGDFITTDLNTEIQMINTNIIAVHTLTKLFLTDMKKRNKGYILNVASIAGFLPGPLMATYYSTKSYIVRLSQAINKELKKSKSNVKISVLCPGPVKTNFNNVANVKFIASYLKSEYVAKYSIDNMFKNKFLLIPGIQNKLLRVLSKSIPDSIISEITYRKQKKKR